MQYDKCLSAPHIIHAVICQNVKTIQTVLCITDISHILCGEAVGTVMRKVVIFSSIDDNYKNYDRNNNV